MVNGSIDPIALFDLTGALMLMLRVNIHTSLVSEFLT